MKTAIFSETESQILELLGSRKISIRDLTEEHYKKHPPLPLNPNNVVSGAIMRINKKCKYYDLDWFINGQGLGRGGKTVWKDKIKKENNKSTAKKKKGKS